MNKTLIINKIDNVAVALTSLNKGETYEDITLIDDIPVGHKFALIDINENEDVIKYGLEGKKTVMVRINTEKGGIMDNVYIKAATNSYFELHVDTDDGNAFLLKQGDKVEILNEN